MDQISQIQPRKDRLGSNQRQSGRAGRSNFGVMKDGARKEVKKTKKLGFESIAARLENDPFFMYNCSMAQLTPPCCEFLEVLANCLSPDHGRSSDARGKGKGTEIRTRLLFTPQPGRNTAIKLNVTLESMVCHSGRFYSLPQFVIAPRWHQREGNPRRSCMVGPVRSSRWMPRLWKRCSRTLQNLL